MSEILLPLELLKVFGLFTGAATGAVSGGLLKELFDHRAMLARQKQTRWLPLLESARELKARLEKLTKLYRNNSPVPPLAFDFWELYTLDKERREFYLDSPELDAILDQSRERQPDVQWVRRRMCQQLNLAASSLYAIAKYIAYAERVRRDLQERRLSAGRAITQCKIIREISCVREKINGTSGAGIIFEQQESIAESLWGPDDRVISYFAFRQRLLENPGWEQFTGLFRFFVHFGMKRDWEVQQTIEALEPLCGALERVSEQEVRAPARIRGYAARYKPASLRA